MTAPLFTILLPVNRPPLLLPIAVASVQAQSVEDFELFIVCDGAPDETVEKAEELASRDSRIRVFPFLKGERHGEAHRHTALREARGKYVAQIADDDFWFPENLSELSLLLDTCDFGNLLQAELSPEDGLTVHIGDLAEETTRRRLLETKWNLFGPSVAGYRLKAYRSLPIGWSPAPLDLWTDLFMWRKFLTRSDLTFATRQTVQCAKLSAGIRKEMTLEERRAEMTVLSQRFATASSRQAYQTRCNTFIADRARSEIAKANASSAKSQQEAQRAKQEVAVLKCTVNELNAALQAAQAELDLIEQRQKALLSSPSWRFTAPFRAGAKALRYVMKRHT